MSLTRVLGWSTLTFLATAFVPALYLQGMVQPVLLHAVPGGQHAACAAVLGLLLLSYRE